MKPLYFLFTLSFFLLFACNKNVNDIPTPEEMTLSNPNNNNNPFDYYGVLHNKALRITLDELHKKPTEINFDKCLSVAYESVQQVLFDEGYIATRTSVNWEEDEEFIALLQFLIEDMENNYENFIAALNIDSHTKAQLQNLFSELIVMAENDAITPDDIFDKVVVFETKVLNNTISIPSNSKEPVLACTSTLRHSLSFWNDELVEIETRSGRKWWKWVVVGLADAVGAISGAATGGAIVQGAVACSAVAYAVVR